MCTHTGIVLYFKLLKALIVLFFFMSLLTLPSLLLYGIAGTKDPIEQAFSTVIESQAPLAYSTLGALGEPIPSCRQVSEGKKFSFRCPSGGVVRSIVSYYGQPSGSCGCPSIQQPLKSGVCNGSISGESSQGKGIFCISIFI